MDVSSSLPPAPGPAAVLVSLSGRSSGLRRPLVDPFTLIGKAAGCDLRLSDDSVAPFHCALLLTPAGPLLRALSADVRLTVNGQSVEHAALVGGDVIAVGAFEFAVEVAPPPTAEIPAADETGLRVQTAAVVAQQAALTELEVRLEGRATALARQEQQLAAHLEQRRAELDERERATAALPEERKQLERQRARLAVLRRRLVSRYRRDGKKGEGEAAERERLRAWYDRANGETELRKRQLQEQARELALDQ
ncbi:MAG: FHA domain-containing protein, partial [Gemmataceae bacterium]